MIEVELPDGTIAEFPDGTPEGVMLNALRSMTSAPQLSQAMVNSPFAQAKQRELTPTGAIQAARTIGSGIVSEPLAGVAGIGQALNPYAEQGAGAQAVESTRAALTPDITSQSGQAALESVGSAISKGLESVNELGRTLGVPETLLRPAADVTAEKFGPAAGAAVAALPTAIMEVIGLGALRKLRPGTRLLDDAGLPTKTLRKQLSKEGLVYDNLTPEVKDKIPTFADKNLIPGGSEVKSAAEDAVINQIKSGGRDDALAGLKVVKDRLTGGDRIAVDPMGAEAVRQGFSSGQVQAAKTASEATRNEMKKMLDISRRTMASERAALDMRPTDVIGDAVNKRLRHIRDTANTSRIELNNIANTKLKGMEIDPNPIVNDLNDVLGKIDVQLTGDGIPKPIFKGSMISKDRTSQRVITDLIDLMAEGGAPDALRFHKLKRQLDTLIDFNKKSSEGLTDAGRNVLKDIRASLNNSLREASPEYAAVNDKLSTALGAIDNYQKVSGSSIDIFGTGSNKALGQDLRGLMSNRKTRVKLENSLDQVEEAASKLGGKFDDDIRDLVQFGNTLDDRFGAVAKTSLKGEVEGAIKRAGQQGAKATVLESAIGKVAEGADKLRGVNDFNAFESMMDLLNKGAN